MGLEEQIAKRMPRFALYQSVNMISGQNVRLHQKKRLFQFSQNEDP